MTQRGKHRGWPISFDGEAWRYDVDGVRVSDAPNRICGHCGVSNTSAGHDPCIANLPRVQNACCGHGDTAAAYVKFNDGQRLGGVSAVAYFAMAQRVRRIREALEEIVCTVPPDDGVVLLSDDGPTHWDEDRQCRVYHHAHFSPLGDALIEVWKLTDPES